jgi:hypothetical protein
MKKRAIVLQTIISTFMFLSAANAQENKVVIDSAALMQAQQLKQTEQKVEPSNPVSPNDESNVCVHGILTNVGKHTS